MIRGVPPFAITRAEFLQLLGSPLIGRRILYAADHRIPPWCDLLRTVRKGGRGCQRLLDYESARACYDRILNGDMPPFMPCEKHSASPPSFTDKDGPAQ